MGIEPTLSAWEAEVLPLNYTRRTLDYVAMIVIDVAFRQKQTHGHEALYSRLRGSGKSDAT